jgi:acyl carrier protein phosphodiesterase
MNYLAHAYLSFNLPEILAGNMISDFVKGKKKFDYSDAIQKGIMLHRAIDEFTDSHPVTKQAKVFFKPGYGLYSGPLIDIVYDHFLANDAAEFTDLSLKKFSQEVYRDLFAFHSQFPGNFLALFSHMQKEDWLYNYRFSESIYKSFAGLVRRAKYMHEHQTAFDIFKTYYDELKACYENFFPSLKLFAFEKLNQLSA